MKVNLEIYEGVQIWSNVEYGGKPCLGKEEFILLKDHESEMEALKHDIERYIQINSELLERISLLEYAAKSLRSCQEEYMVNRGNDEIGKSVAEAAKYLDDVLNNP